MTDFTNETAREARDEYESMQMALSLPWGEKLKAKIDDIERTAYEGAMRGKTPENTNVFFESRGKVGAVWQLKQLIEDTTKNNADAIKWQQANPPVEANTASEKAE